MALPTQPLRDGHHELFPQIELLGHLADAVSDAPVAALQQGVDQACNFLGYQVLPLNQAEERILYPAVERLLGAAQTTATMVRDHAEISRLARDLRALRDVVSARSIDMASSAALRRTLYGLHALLTLHLTKEEEVYLPLLDARLSAEEALHLYTAMETIAIEARRTLDGG